MTLVGLRDLDFINSFTTLVLNKVCNCNKRTTVSITNKDCQASSQIGLQMNPARMVQLTHEARAFEISPDSKTSLNMNIKKQV